MDLLQPLYRGARRRLRASNVKQLEWYWAGLPGRSAIFRRENSPVCSRTQHEGVQSLRFRAVSSNRMKKLPWSGSGFAARNVADIKKPLVPSATAFTSWTTAQA